MIPIEETIIRLLLGALIGGIIGFEREVHGRAAGFRTQLIVCVASVLIMIISENYYLYMRSYDPTLRIDPARISAGALIGIGFLGSGVIVKSGFAIRGLTTAASIWIVSAIGLAIGAGLYLEGIITTAITIIALVLLRKVEKNIKTLIYRNVIISTLIAENIEEKITSLFSDYRIHIHSIDYEKDLAAGNFTYHFHIATRDRHVLKEVFSKLSSFEFVKAISMNSYKSDTF